MSANTLRDVEQAGRAEPEVSVLVVTYNSSEHIRHCLDTLLSQENVNLEIIVVDNNSEDTTQRILGSYNDRITMIANNSNVGFGRANNQAASLARGEYLYLVNPDAYLDGPKTLARLVDHARQDPAQGIVGTRVRDSTGTSETLPKLYYPRQKHSDFSGGDLPGDIAWIIGASMLVRSGLYRVLGGFDEEYFMYGEEADFCLRARLSGCQIGFCERSSVTHIGGGSEDADNPYERWLKRQQGLRTFCHKHYSTPSYSRIMQRERQRARLGKAWYLLTHPLQGRSQRMKGKYARYQAVLDATSVQ